LNNNAQKKSTKLAAHLTRGSVLDELNMSEQDRLELKLKADLHQDILKLIQKKKNLPANWKNFLIFRSPESANFCAASSHC
jgi:hypothetical protein